jgi:hypothetical protein
MALHPDRTNRVTCSVCGWTRIIDHVREYRGGHTSAENGINECHEKLEYAEVDVRPPHASWFEADEVFTPEWEEVPGEGDHEGEMVWVGVALG